MQEIEKTTLLVRAKEHIVFIQDYIQTRITEAKQQAADFKAKIAKLPPSEIQNAHNVQAQFTHKAENLEALYPSPYFIKCTLKFDDDTSNRIFYFAKQSLPEQNIYSWVTPAAGLRFENPGAFSYSVPNSETKTGILLSKESYLITNGEIVFMATESADQPRELIYQAYFSGRKTNFLLPEIVEQMEQAQDKVIRAHPFGSFLIAGPAGSGKTTLALHRVAYLVQSPDTAEQFNEQAAIVFVQDHKTRAYFAELLPQLGLHGVSIITFGDWVIAQLGLSGFVLAERFGGGEVERDIYEYAKLEALKNIPKLVYSADVYGLLSRVYVHLPAPAAQIFKIQTSQKVLDRFDLTCLLHIFLATHRHLFTEETTYKQLRGGKVKRSKEKKPIYYGLMVLDEVQNFLPEQIRLLRKCLDGKNHSLVYVGDLAQQTKLGTLRQWEEVGEHLSLDQQVVLQKNYRLTKSILEYIKDLGFAVDIPEQLRAGEQVQEVVVDSASQEVEYVTALVAKKQAGTIGILAKNKELLAEYEALFAEKEGVFVLTFHEAQGVEFDSVCIVGINKSTFSVPNAPAELAIAVKKVNQDLLYVALTRAMNELHICASIPLSQVIKNLQEI